MGEYPSGWVTAQRGSNARATKTPGTAWSTAVRRQRNGIDEGCPGFSGAGLEQAHGPGKTCGPVEQCSSSSAL